MLGAHTRQAVPASPAPADGTREPDCAQAGQGGRDTSAIKPAEARRIGTIRAMRWAVALLCPLPVHAAWAKPWDTLQVIMWQDHSPAQTAGLARLGFTGTMLFGTGAQIDPADLAARQRSGLPWYVENIATDFYAPYHRWFPGKTVTWMFDAAKARRRADPGDSGVFMREPGLSDPAWTARIQARLDQVVRSQSQFRPLFYNLADEAGIGDLAAAWDADVSPHSLAGMREWLHGRYPSLDALNRQWGTAFAEWDAVTPELTDAAMRRTDDNFSSWADFKAWMDVAFARAVRTGTEAVHQADPEALAALEGGQVPGWGGYDYGLLAPAVDVMEIYDTGNSMELARAFNPALIALRTSFASGLQETHAAWRHLLQGGRGMVVWDENNDVVQPDGSPGPRGRYIAALVASLQGVAPEIMASETSYDPVAVLYSQASFRTRWMLDQRPKGTAWSDRDAAREYEDNAWRASRRQALQRLGELAVQPRILSSAMVEAGALRRNGLRVLVLPHAIALSQAEADEVAAFIAGGGTVLADTEPGVFDEHSRRRPAPVLAGKVQVLEAMQLDVGQSGSGALAAVAALLRGAGVAPRAELRGPDGQPAAGVGARWLRRGDTTMLALHALVPWGAPARIEVRLSAPASVRDLRQGGPPLATGDIAVQLDPVEPTILALTR